MNTFKALLLTDVVDSTQLALELGEARIAALWAEHDRLARDLLPLHRGREIDKTDGMLLLFDQAADAIGYALAYQAGMAALNSPMRARAGLHVGPVVLRENSAADVARGAKPLEVDGAAKATAARVMSVALGGQILLTDDALQALGAAAAPRTQSHGHWRLKGLAEPVELFEVGADGAPFMPPPDGDKAYRVVHKGDLWLPVREIRHSLPAERDPFVGREPALAEMAQQLQAGARLLSVLGVGGTGKTRLVTHFGWTWLGEYPGGIWFCDLTTARTPEGVALAVAQGLDVPLGGGDPVMQLGNAIAGRGPCLVIVDNVEQVVRETAATVGKWLDKAPQARFVMTTRELLGLPGERVLALEPLPIDDGVVLFRQRAEAVVPGFKPGAEDEQAIAPLVRLLDGLPLAIELAAARVRVMSPRQLLQRMGERFRLLAAPGQRQDRQATMRATLDWSWDLLAQAERAALAQLSVFEGGFTLEAAEAVLDFAGFDEAPWAVDAVTSLVDKSLVQPRRNDRFDLLVSVQDYAAEHLRTEGRYPGSGPAALSAARRRHAEWFASLGPKRATENRCADIDNLVTACRRAIVMADPDLAARALEVAWAGLDWTGPYPAGAALAEVVRAMPGLAGRSMALVLLILAAAQKQSGISIEARANNEQSLVVVRAAGDPHLEVRVMRNLADVLYRLNDMEASRAMFVQSIERARALGDRESEFGSIGGLGAVELIAGRFEEARRHLEQALAMARETSDGHRQSALLAPLGGALSALGDHAGGAACVEEALVLARADGHRRIIGDALANLGFIRYLQGRHAESESATLEGLQVFREVGQLQKQGTALHNLALAREALGRTDEAQADYEAALAIYRVVKDRRNLGECLMFLGLLHARAGRPDEAARCLDESESVVRNGPDRTLLGMLFCARAEAQHLVGNAVAAARWLDDAAAEAVACEATPGSELGVTLARVKAMLATA